MASSSVPNQKANWATAYFRFLTDRNESLTLKLMPLVVAGVLPEVIAANLVPFVGEIGDAGGFGFTAVVIYKTLKAVRRHR